MKVIVLENKKEVGKYAAELIVTDISKKKNLVLGLASGETMKPVYRNLILMNRGKKVNFSHVKTFNLDEYVSLKAKDRGSLRHFMDKNFFSEVNLSKRNINFLQGDSNDLMSECRRYEEKIRKERIDLQILGLGLGGHIGFNEPGSKLKSKTRIVKLTEKTRKSEEHFFHSLDKVPRYALTIGIGTIMSAKKVLLIATGKHKAEIVNKTLKGKIGSKLPASFLRGHKNCLVLLDRAAAERIENFNSD